MNNLAASTPLHKLLVLEPPEGMREGTQRKAVQFFWSKQHWTQAAVLYLLIEERGKGLVDIKNWIQAFRLQAAKNFWTEKLYHEL